MNNQQEIMQNEDVVVVSRQDAILIGHTTFKVNDLMQELTIRIKNEAEGTVKKWCLEGVDCQVLCPKQNWRKGKVKFCLEFVPDEAESPLDDIRQQINNNVDK